MFWTKVKWCNEHCKLVLTKFWKKFFFRSGIWKDLSWNAYREKRKSEFVYGRDTLAIVEISRKIKKIK